MSNINHLYSMSIGTMFFLLFLCNAYAGGNGNNDYQHKFQSLHIDLIDNDSFPYNIADECTKLKENLSGQLKPLKIKITGCLEEEHIINSPLEIKVRLGHEEVIFDHHDENVTNTLHGIVRLPLVEKKHPLSGGVSFAVQKDLSQDAFLEEFHMDLGLAITYLVNEYQKYSTEME